MYGSTRYNTQMNDLTFQCNVDRHTSERDLPNMPRINVVSSVPGAESVVRQLLCEPVVGVSCRGTKHTSKM